jgi:hypothetical protein
MNSKIRWLRISYWVGAIVNGLYVIPMLSPRIGGALYRIEDFNPGVEYQYAMSVGAALMLGWTLLLLWADRKPVERRGVLLLTIFPVKVGLDLASIYIIAYGIIAWQDMIASWVIGLLVYLLFIYSYVNSRDLVQEAA